MTAQTFENLLAIDTATPTLRLAVGFGGDRLVKSADNVQRSHGQVLMKKIRELLESSGQKPTDLDALIVSLGPGSFTGVRIGLAASKGMAVALDKPILGVSLFDLAGAKLAVRTYPVRVIVPFRRDEYVMAVCGEGNPVPRDIAPISRADLVPQKFPGYLTGIGMEAAGLGALTPMLPAEPELDIDAADLLYFGRERLEAGERSDLESLEPLYFGKSQAEIRFEQRQAQR